MFLKFFSQNRPISPKLHKLRLRSVLMLLLILSLSLPSRQNVHAEPLSGFVEDKVFVGLQQPTAIQFAADGRVFVAEKSGIIKVFDNLTDETPTVFADLNVNVYNFWDRGLLGMALDPNFPSNPYVYVLYAYDAVIGGTAPRWGTPGVLSDPCPGPPGPTSDGCVVSGRLSRLQANGNVMTGSEQVLIEDWCQQYPSHSLGSLAFGADGALYVTGGEGASFTFVDYGQDGNPVNPCGDPPGGVGGVQTPPTAEGGALRSQDLRTPGDPVSLGGMVLRLNPSTGAAMPDNPMAGNPDPNARRIIASGLRNPFRMTVRPGTNELWIGDVGWLDWEELNRITNPTDGLVENFGWPCYEGPNRQSGYDSANLNICENLYNSAGAVTDPYFTYNHNSQLVPGESCATGSSATAGLAFYQSGPFPDEYDGALFMADYSRNCIWAMLKGANGLPSTSLIRTFYSGARSPVDLKVGPDGNLYYADFGGGTIRRVRYTGTSGGTLPEPWVSQNVGTVGIVGSASYNNGIFTVLGSGADIGGTTDAFRYVYQPLNGDGSITARVASVQLKSDVAAKAGVMIRETLTAGSRHASMFVSRGNGLAFQRRLTTDGTSVSTVGAAAVAPYWVRLIRSGSTITGFQSADGVNWVQVGSDTVSMGTNVFIGLAVNSHNNTVTTTATFDTVTVSTNNPNNQPPTAIINTPAAGTTWKVDDLISFSGSGTDPEDGPLPPSALYWTVTMQHCPSNCHAHLLQTFPGGDSGSFTAPDHEYPSYLELQLTVTDSGGLQDTETLRLDPQTVALTFQSAPSGVQLTVGGSSSIAPFTRTVIVGSTNSVSAPSSQVVGGTLYNFQSWSDDGAQSHDIAAPASPATYTAQYAAAPATNTPTITPSGTPTHTPAPFTPTHTPTNTSVGPTPTNTPGLVVETNADNTTPDGNCTLREAIINANNNAASFPECAAGSGADTITFDASLAGQTITLTSDMPLLSGNLTIDGSALASQVTIDGASLYRPFYVNAGGTFTLDSLSVSHAKHSSGAALFSNGATVTVENSTFSGSSASNTGAAVQNDFGIMTVSNSTFSGNTVTNIDGGGIYNKGTLTVTNSTFSGNTVPNLDGGGGGHGGGIYNSGTLTVTNSTFSGNGAAASGGGIYNTGTLNYSNTIIANSTGGDCTLNAGSIGTNTTNLVEDGSCSASLSGDPSLGALADYGGPTQTMALQSGSLAIDAGDDATCAAAPVNNLDQRGVTRPLDGNGDSTATCDVGAYEAPVPGAATTTPTPTNTPLGPTPTFTNTPTNTPTSTPAPPTPTHTATNTPGPGGDVSTGFLAPSADAAETTKAGDNDGYEVSPGNAYAADGLVAIDANSGTSSDLNCTSIQKDKHRFYNFNFNIPTFTALRGIEVRLTGSAATTASTPRFCIQLSWNRGDTWTAAQFVPLSTTNATYVLGSPTDTWGRTWAPIDFTNTNFRVRVIDVSSSTTNTFSLDAIAVNVTYTTGNTSTNTPTPTNTPLGPTPTFTNTPTNTPTFTPTNTPAPVTPTHTPTITLTHTPAPPTPTHTATNTPGPGGDVSTGFLAPSADAAETTKAGDNDGYEVSPGNAYAADGLVAIDANSGTSTETTCTSQLKDKHRFYNFNFNIPTFTALRGIEVRLTGSAATTASTPRFCIQLSWSRGDAWTAAQSIPLTTVNSAYVLGSPTDTWGRTWAPIDFTNTNFRVRIIDIASSTTNTFSLDGIAVNITYQP